MQNVKISLVHRSLLDTSASVAYVKHIEGQVCMPEKAIDERLGSRLSAAFLQRESGEPILLESTELPFSSLCVIPFSRVELPFRYSSVDSYARKIIDHAASDPGIKVITMAVHGPGAGLDASEALETMLLAFASELQSHGGAGIEEIIIAEKDRAVFERLQERLRYLETNKGIISFTADGVFLKPQPIARDGASEQHRVERLALRHLFVAMPYAKQFNNVYYFGIKGPIEQRGRKCERVDQEKFLGDVVDRIKERIATAALVIADITGHNPNVFYELGYAEGLKKKIILISQKQEIPFDLRTQSQTIYDPGDILSLAQDLGELVDAALAT